MTNIINWLKSRQILGIILIPVWIFLIRRKIFFSEYFYSYRYYKTNRVFRMNDLTIGIRELGRKKTVFFLPIGIAIGRGVQIGENCIIYQNVTIGAKNQEDTDNNVYPKIGNNVLISASAIVIGNVSIGNNVIIGAAILVNKDIPDNAIVVGNPAKIIGYKNV